MNSYLEAIPVDSERERSKLRQLRDPSHIKPKMAEGSGSDRGGLSGWFPITLLPPAGYWENGRQGRPYR